MPFRPSPGWLTNSPVGQRRDLRDYRFNIVMSTDAQTIKTRYPGSKPFTRDDESLFFGRAEEIARLTTFIKVEKTTILYGKSGLGKSSLLNAGVLPRLESEHQYYIIPVRFGSYTQETRKHPLDIVEDEIAGFHQPDDFLQKIEPQDISLWQHIKSLELTLPNQAPILLVFDQFEELFTYPAGITDFAEALADLLYSRMPKSFQRALRLAERNNPALLTLEESEFLLRPVNVKVLMSIRSDRLSMLDSLSSHIPSILLNCYELQPLSREQAEEAIVSPAEKAGEFQSPAFTYQPEALKKILDYLTRKNAKPIESFQLQILCHYVEESIVIAKNDTNVGEADLGDLETIYQNYYNDSLKKLGTKEEQLRAQIFIEEGLIFEKEERRITLYEGQIQSMYDVSPELLRKLADTHIIRSEPHSSGGYTYEVSHDTLVGPILKAKALRSRRQQAEKAQLQLLETQKKRKRKIIRATVVLTIPAILVSLTFILTKFTLPREYDYLVSKAGFFLLFLISAGIVFSSIVSPLAFFYEFVSGESLLSKLRKRAENPAKQKGLLTKLGRWLS